MNRLKLGNTRLENLFHIMRKDVLAPEEKLIELREALSLHYETKIFKNCKSMGDLVHAALDWVLG